MGKAATWLAQRRAEKNPNAKCLILCESEHANIRNQKIRQRTVVRAANVMSATSGERYWTIPLLAVQLSLLGWQGTVCFGLRCGGAMVVGAVGKISGFSWETFILEVRLWKSFIFYSYIITSTSSVGTTHAKKWHSNDHWLILPYTIELLTDWIRRNLVISATSKTLYTCKVVKSYCNSFMLLLGKISTKLPNLTGTRSSFWWAAASSATATAPISSGRRIKYRKTLARSKVAIWQRCLLCYLYLFSSPAKAFYPPLLRTTVSRSYLPLDDRQKSPEIFRPLHSSSMSPSSKNKDNEDAPVVRRQSPRKKAQVTMTEEQAEETETVVSKVKGAKKVTKTTTAAVTVATTKKKKTKSASSSKSDGEASDSDNSASPKKKKVVKKAARKKRSSSESSAEGASPPKKKKAPAHQVLTERDPIPKLWDACQHKDSYSTFTVAHVVWTLFQRLKISPKLLVLFLQRLRLVHGMWQGFVL